MSSASSGSGIGATPSAMLSSTDLPTLAAVSALAYVVAVALHEHGGHAAACALLGSHPKEMGAFYVECDNAQLSGLRIRMVALAGPLASLATGTVALALLHIRSPRSNIAYYFTWLLGCLGLMSAAGYPLFSGVSGLGDLGTTQDGALFEVAPEGAWRVALVIVGIAAYYYVVRIMCRAIEPMAGAPGGVGARVARRATLASYIAGAVVYLAIGALNPMGWTIVLLSVLPSSLGATSGLLWMWRTYARHQRGIAVRGFGLPRSWMWIGISVLGILAYAFVFGPTLRD